MPRYIRRRGDAFRRASRNQPRRISRAAKPEQCSRVDRDVTRSVVRRKVYYIRVFRSAIHAGCGLISDEQTLTRKLRPNDIRARAILYLYYLRVAAEARRYSNRGIYRRELAVYSDVHGANVDDSLVPPTRKCLRTMCRVISREKTRAGKKVRCARDASSSGDEKGPFNGGESFGFCNITAGNDPAATKNHSTPFCSLPFPPSLFLSFFLFSPPRKPRQSFQRTRAAL